MTCREFKHSAAELSLFELAQTKDPQLTGHAQACAACAAWLERQRTLNASLHTLRVRTAGREAGSDVERALLSVFRQDTPAPQLAVAGERLPASGVKGPNYNAAPRSTPIAMRLSRWFELGAYAAVAAAIAVAIFLGIHLLQHGPAGPIHGNAGSERTTPAIQQPVVAASSSPALTAKSSHKLAPSQRRRALSEPTVAQKPLPHDDARPSKSTAGAVYEAQAVAYAGYTALLLCDPLSCASDTQVVRMELPPPAAGPGAQPQTADLLVGYDGAVRAVRFVN